jgi:hypothetical protein
MRARKTLKKKNNNEREFPVERGRGEKRSRKEFPVERGKTYGFIKALFST